MSLPNGHALVVLGVAIGAFYLYTRPQVRMEMVALLVLLSLALIFHLFPYGAGAHRIDDATMLSGFGHPVLIAIVSLMILGRGLMMTGALEPAVRMLTRLWKWSPRLGLLATLLFGVGASAFVNDTPVLVTMLPMLLGIAERTGISAASTLMPVNFAILGGGMITSLGTSTNLLVISIAIDLGVRPIGLFDFTAISAGALLVSVPYLWLVAPRLLPARQGATAVAGRPYAARVLIGPRDPLAGRTIGQAGRLLGRALPLTEVLREGRSVPVSDSFLLAAGDVLLLSDTPRGLHEIAAAFAVAMSGPDAAADTPAGQGSHEGDESVVEVVVGPRSPLCAATLEESRFAARFGVAVIAMHRSDTDLLHAASRIGDTILQAGDLLLVRGTEARVEALRGQWDLMLLDSRLVVPRTPLAPWALGIMATVVALAATHVLPIHIAAMLGVVAMLWKGCVRFEGVGRALSLEVLLLVASSIALGLALVGSGAADWLAAGVVAAVAGLPAAVVVASVMAMAAMLTNFVSNSAAAAIGTPIAVAMAGRLALPPEPFVLAILFGANLSYATPMAYQTNLLVMNAAGYGFREFVKVGLPLVVLTLGTLSFLLVRHYAL